FPNELELTVPSHLDVKLLVLVDLVLLGVFRRPGHTRISFDACHVRPDGRHEQKHHEAEQKVDERDEGNFVVGRTFSVTTTNINTSHLAILASSNSLRDWTFGGRAFFGHPRRPEEVALSLLRQRVHRKSSRGPAQCLNNYA